MIIKYIVYKNCKNIFKIVCYNKYNCCIKYFSKSKYKKISLIYFFNYLEYCRFSFDKRSKIYNIWNNIWIIIYNTYLLKKYNYYLNIEIYTSTKSIKYFYKYIFKRSNFANIFIVIIFDTLNCRINKIRNNRNNTTTFTDKIFIFYNAC